MAVIKIDNQNIEFEPTIEKTILDVAREAGIYIPTLCDHDELEPYGGCRMCLVDVEGMRGYVPACTTTAKDGMVVKTSTDELNSLKRRILQLLMIEHPVGCILCDEREQCDKFRPQAQKAGRVSGCYTCPNRNHCELEEVVNFIGMKTLPYDPEYRDIPVEREDPFFDRDYNLCILCARCVRVCDDVRGTAAITIAKRGHESRIDTAFGTSHVESGCWFCGACVDVCPTGSLSARKTKWIGIPEETVETTCVLCGTGCQVNIGVKYNKIMWSEPGNKDSPPNHHHMCVLGRFCIPTLVNTPRRTKNPMITKDSILVPASWDEAINEAARLLKDTPSEKIGFIASPQMTTEAAYLLQKIAREGANTSAIDFMGSDFAALILGNLADGHDKIQTLDKLDEVDWILSIGGDFVVTHQVVAKSVYKQVRRNVPLIHVGPIGENLRRWASYHINVPIKKIENAISKLAQKSMSIPSITKEQAERIASIISSGRGAIIVGSRIMETKNPDKCLSALLEIIGREGVVYPLLPLGNELGLIKAGARADILPGPAVNSEKGLTLGELRDKASKGQIELLYITDGSVSLTGFEKVENIIYQAPYASEWTDRATVLLPSASFAEEDGTFVNHEMRELRLKRIVDPPYHARQDWEILQNIARSIGLSKSDYKSPEDIWNELEKQKAGLKKDIYKRKSWTPARKDETRWNPKYRGVAIAEVVKDLKVLIDSLPSREVIEKRESLDELLERLQRKIPSKEVLE